MTNEETQITTFFSKYDPPMRELGVVLRAKLRARLPGLTEIVYVYERQDALVFSYSPSDHGYEGLCALSVYPDRVQLSFPQGGRLAASDPKKLLQGRGAGVRHVVMATVAEFDRPEIEALIGAALALANVRPEPGATGRVILKAEEQKRRAARSAAGGS